MITENNKPSFPPLRAEVFSYADLVQYQEGSVVSRTIIDAPTGTVTVFAFAKDQRLNEHTAPFDALIEVVESSGIITIDGREFRVPAGSQIIMPAGHPHAVSGDGRFKMVLVMIRSRKNL
ncbi:MAG: cupin domain-containing protein [Chitinispirillaceae bacterium]|nr:cupin domain-containing protein [Chitinispirillaceae bacterium]